jgi:uncharacterized membrane protein YeiB
VSGFLDKLAGFLSTDFGVVTTLTVISVLGLNIIGQKLTEQRIARENNAIQQKINLAKLKQAKAESDIVLKQKEERLTALKTKKANLDILLTKLKTLQSEGKLTASGAKALAWAEKESVVVAKDLEVAQQEYDLELAKNKSLNDQIGLQQMQTDNAMSLTGALSGIVAILGTIIGLYKLMAIGIGIVIKLTKKEERAKLKAAIADKIKAA